MRYKTYMLVTVLMNLVCFVLGCGGGGTSNGNPVTSTTTMLPSTTTTSTILTTTTTTTILPNGGLPPGTKFYKLESFDFNLFKGSSPELMSLSISGNHVSGRIISNTIDGCGTIDGTQEVVAFGPKTMSLTIALNNGRVLNMSTSGMNFTITDRDRMYTGYFLEIEPETHSAAIYGVTTTGPAAISITNNSTRFDIKSVSFWSSSDCFQQVYGSTTVQTGQNPIILITIPSIASGKNAVYTVPPGPYYIKVEYTATSDGTSAIRWLCEGSDYETMAIETGKAAVLSLQGGLSCSATYTAPFLVKQ